MQQHAASSPQSAFRLAKALGVFAILASAVSQEYGVGINFVLVSSLGSYPAITYLVPLAMFMAGIVLIPKVALFARFSQVMPRCGSTYAWMTRSLNLPFGFIVAFIWLASVNAAIGFVAFSISSFLAGFLVSIGLAGAWALAPAGHIAVGLIAIGLIFWLHYSGVQWYGRFVTIIFWLVILAALLTSYYGFATSQATFLTHAGSVLAPLPQPPADQTPSLGAFISVVTVFLFAYGGLTAATALGGESRDAMRTMPRGIILGWATALVLFTLVASALFHAVPWWIVNPLVKAKHAELTTAPGLIGLVAPRAVGALLNLLVMIIAAKTIAPQMLDSSRYLFAWAQDGLLPKAFLHTARSKAPDVALVVTAALAVLFLFEATFLGWQIGVTFRAIGLVLVFMAVGVGALNVFYNKLYDEQEWVQRLRVHRDVPIFAGLAIVIGLVLLGSVVRAPGVAFWFQPSVQAVVAAIAGAVIFASARGRSVAGPPLPAPVE